MKTVRTLYRETEDTVHVTTTTYTQCASVNMNRHIQYEGGLKGLPPPPYCGHQTDFYEMREGKGVYGMAAAGEKLTYFSWGSLQE